MKFYLVLCTCLLSGIFVLAQPASVRGYVRDARTGEVLIAAGVADASRQTGVVTNNFGFFALRYQARDSVRLVVSYIGYQPVYQHFVVRRDTLLNLLLQPADALTDTVEIVAGGPVHETQMGSVTLTPLHIRKMPALMGESDVLKAIQLMPGFKGGAEGTTGIFVRGGSPDQNLLLLDDVPLYYVNHFGGLVSLFDTDALSSVQAFKGGFPARYGGRTSGVIDLRMRDGSTTRRKWAFTLSPITNKVATEGPIRGGKGSYMLSGRVCNLAPFFYIGNTVNGNTNQESYFFYDLYAKGQYQLSPKDRLYVSGYFGRDNIMARQRSRFTTDIGRIQWGNVMASVRWNRQIRPTLFANITLADTHFDYRTVSLTQTDAAQALETYRKSTLSSAINDQMLKADLDWYRWSRHRIRLGGALTVHHFHTADLVTETVRSGERAVTDLSTKPMATAEIAAYVEDEYRFSERISANAGLHLALYGVEKRLYPSVQPRLSLRYLVSDKASVKASYCEMTQFLHLLSNSAISLPNDVWIPVTRQIPPQRSRQVALGWVQELPKGLTLTAEAYFKSLRNQVDYLEGRTIDGSVRDWQRLVVTGGRGWAYGLEVLLQRSAGRTQGWIGYTLSWSNRQFSQLNQGQLFPSSYDRRHEVGASVTHTINQTWSAAITGVFSSGRPITPPISTYEVVNSTTGEALVSVQQYGPRNSFRLPVYHRVDVAVQKTLRKRRGEAQWSYGAYNAYNQMNAVFYVAYRPAYVGYQSHAGVNWKDLTTEKSFTLFPFIPYIAWTRRW